MPSPHRRAKLFRGDLSPAFLDRLTWAQLTVLAADGLITWAEIHVVLGRKATAAGPDPYAHLREGR